jgi:hypothetical protein
MLAPLSGLARELMTFLTPYFSQVYRFVYINEARSL